MIKKIKGLNEIVHNQRPSLAEMALDWWLTDQLVSSVIIGASSTTQIAANLKALENTNFSNDDLKKIELICE